MATTDSVRTHLARRDEPAQAVATTPAHSAVERMRGEFTRVIGDQIGVDRFIRVALTELRTNPALAACSQESLLGALMTCAQLGLEPGRATGEAWLVPFKGECTFIPGYKGLLKLAWQSGQIASFSAKVVYTEDSFEYMDGAPEAYVRHRPLLHGERGQAYAWYAAATIKGGGAVFEVLGRDDVERIRRRSKAKDSGPWQTDYDAMARKTAVRQLSKSLPMSVKFAAAVALDETVRVDPAPTPLEEHVAAQPAPDPEPDGVPL